MEHTTDEENCPFFRGYRKEYDNVNIVKCELNKGAVFALQLECIKENYYDKKRNG